MTTGERQSVSDPRQRALDAIGRVQVEEESWVGKAKENLALIDRIAKLPEVNSYLEKTGLKVDMLQGLLVVSVSAGEPIISFKYSVRPEPDSDREEKSFVRVDQEKVSEFWEDDRKRLIVTLIGSLEPATIFASFRNQVKYLTA